MTLYTQPIENGCFEKLVSRSIKVELFYGVYKEKKRTVATPIPLRPVIVPQHMYCISHCQRRRNWMKRFDSNDRRRYIDFSRVYRRTALYGKLIIQDSVANSTWRFINFYFFRKLWNSDDSTDVWKKFTFCLHILVGFFFRKLYSKNRNVKILFYYLNVQHARFDNVQTVKYITKHFILIILQI